jgi:lipoyl(octanoyl) transferase
MAGAPLPRWRLLDSGPADAFTNMAVDEAILESYAATGGLPTVRFYTWSPPAVSLGYGQPVASDIDQLQCQALGIDIVRRPTGGRAVLHDHEVTYSIVIRADDPRVAPGVLAAYLMVSQALIRGLSFLGIAAELLPLRRGIPASAEAVNPACFATPSSYEVAVGGRKIIGSAQRRLQGVIMQHGSIPISWDLDKMGAVFGRSPSGNRPAASEMAYHTSMTSLQEAGGRAYEYGEVVSALTRGITETWGVELIPGELTVAERRLGTHLRGTKYHTASWTLHR